MIMKKVTIVSRVLLGSAFFLFGLNGFLNFIPMAQVSVAISDFLNGLVHSDKIFPLLKISEIILGALLLSGYFIPLVLIILTPFLVNIFIFHLFLAPSTLIVPITLITLHIILTFSYWSNYKMFFTPQNAWKE
jgi:putative oxidoreductase